MNRNRALAPAAALAAALMLGACARPIVQSAPAPEHDHAGMVPVRTNPQAIAEARADSMRLPYTQADVEFMTNMVGHHAQAIVMSRMAPENGASAAVQRLAARIINAQQDEITLMQQWLIDRQKPVPMAHTTWPMPDEHHMHHMAPGMLTPAQLKELHEARGTQFDRLFLSYMIMHHKGAIAMVKELFASPGAAQDHTVFRFASDVNVDQTTEVARMELMLRELSNNSQQNQS